jgi:hypothetical protein
MTMVSNKTRRPLRVPLPGGRTLHLGPEKAGQISSKDAEHPAIKKLAEDSVIEIVDEDARRTQGGGDGGKGRTFVGGHARGSGSRRSGDR